MGHPLLLFGAHLLSCLSFLLSSYPLQTSDLLCFGFIAANNDESPRMSSAFLLFSLGRKSVASVMVENPLSLPVLLLGGTKPMLTFALSMKMKQHDQ